MIEVGIRCTQNIFQNNLYSITINLMTTNPITPALWFHTNDGKIQTVLSYYQTIF